MPGRCNELDAESAQIPADRAEYVGVGLTPIAAAGTHFPQLQGTAEQAEQLAVQWPGQHPGAR